jgi:phytoene dehydrogenase-like protein
VFERDDRLGGRLQDIHIDAHRFENGGSILHESNLYMKYFTRLLNLTIQTPPVKLEKSAAIWDGEQFELTGSTLLDAWRILWHYDFPRLSKAISTVADRFGQVYRTADDGLSFNTPTDLLNSLGLQALKQQAPGNWAGDKFQDDLVLGEMASTRVSSGQGLGINAMSGAVGLIPLTAWSVAEGTAGVVEGLRARKCVRVRERPA